MAKVQSVLQLQKDSEIPCRSGARSFPLLPLSSLLAHGVARPCFSPSAAPTIPVADFSCHHLLQLRSSPNPHPSTMMPGPVSAAPPRPALRARRRTPVRSNAASRPLSVPRGGAVRGPGGPALIPGGKHPPPGRGRPPDPPPRPRFAPLSNRPLHYIGKLRCSSLRARSVEPLN